MINSSLNSLLKLVLFQYQTVAIQKNSSNTDENDINNKCEQIYILICSKYELG